MKLIAIFFGLASLAGCVSLPSERDKLIDTIETRVRLPQGAETLRAYSRNYAYLPDRKIIGVYVLPMEPLASSSGGDVGCEIAGEIDADGNTESSPCTDTDMAELAAHDRQRAETFGKAGECRWFAEYLDLPSIVDGGCSQVTIVFDPRTETFERTECNGSL